MLTVYASGWYLDPAVPVARFDDSSLGMSKSLSDRSQITECLDVTLIAAQHTCVAILYELRRCSKAGVYGLPQCCLDALFPDPSCSSCAVRVNLAIFLNLLWTLGSALRTPKESVLVNVF